MNDNSNNSPETNTDKPETAKMNPKQQIIVVLAIFLLIAIIVGIVFAVIGLSRMSDSQTGQIRDIFIIFMAVEFLIIGVALIVMIIQIAALINLLQNEVKPILNATNETVSTLKGTTKFLSDNMVEPVIKMNEYLAGLKKLLDTINIFK